jgi:hypothetical protein
MSAAPLGPPLHVTRLRALTIDARAHPRGLAHLHAASGLVCAHGLAYVVADDEHHLAVFSDAHGAGALYRIAPGRLPHDAAARKRRKRDFEVLFAASRALVTLGSGSRRRRGLGAWIALDAHGLPGARPRLFDLAALYEPLAARLGAINIEGAFVQGARFTLLNRCADDNAGNVALQYPLRALRDVIDGSRSTIAPREMHTYALGELDGVPLGFTDAAVLPRGGWVYSAAAEARAGSIADGPYRGSVIGIVGTNGAVRAQRTLATPHKIEGVAVQQRAALELCLVSDADDPDQPSCMLRARW